ncbi:Tetratricopeptide repeat protein [Nymphaea thermarum]|nr:Tetratricopeptide repeat protein [Nymphaea thermarum]
MEETDEFVRELELRLLRCSLPPSRRPPSPSYSRTHRPGSLGCLVEEIVSLIEKGSYAEALSSDAARIVFDFADGWQFENAKACADQFYAQVEQSAEKFLKVGAEDRQSSEPSMDGESGALVRGVLVMAIAVAAFLAFTQCNLTGPPSEGFHSVPLWFLLPKENSMSEWDLWARQQLFCDGSDLLGKLFVLQYLVYAKRLLVKVNDSSSDGGSVCFNKIRSNSWWLLRLLVLHQRILEERSPSLYNALQALIQVILHDFGDISSVDNYWRNKLCEGEASTITSAAHLEAGIIEHLYGRIDNSRKHFQSAEESCGLQLSVTGLLGFRTIHQVEAKAQMVLVSTSDRGDSAAPGGSIVSVDESDGDLVVHSQTDYEDCDILLAPRLVGNVDDAGNNVKSPQDASSAVLTLNTTQQCVALAQCLLIKRTTPDDDMQKWQMAPFIEAVDAQRLSHFIVRFCCHIQRIRWESTRSRTKQRALIMMENLVNKVCEACPSAAQRIKFSFGVSIPIIPALRNLLQKKAAAVDLINSRLCDRPDDPKLWCSLGDVTNNDENYVKALEVSNGKSARALRSLARSAYSREDYEVAKNHWEAALALNPLFPDGWFAFASAALKARDFDKAIEGFTRAVQLDPENGEAWNNLACIHMIKKRSKEAFIAFKEGLKFRRSSWQMWENYGQVAMDISNVSQALEAVKMTFELSNNKRVDVVLLERVIIEMEGRSNSMTDKQTAQLMDFLGNILHQIAKSGKGEGIWGLYARWHKLRGDLTMCSEALLKQVRAYQGSDLWHNEERFKKFASASLQLCQIWIEIASTTGSSRELNSAKMHLRNAIKQAVDFSATKEYGDLQACHTQVEQLLNSGLFKHPNMKCF